MRLYVKSDVVKQPSIIVRNERILDAIKCVRSSDPPQAWKDAKFIKDKAATKFVNVLEAHIGDPVSV
jgi:hypothetical protein